MHSDLVILGREAGSSPPSLSSALGGLTPIKYPPFPEAAWGELLRPFKRRLTVKSMHGTHRSAERGSAELTVEASRRSLRFDMSALFITGVSTGEER